MIGIGKKTYKTLFRNKSESRDYWYLPRSFDEGKPDIIVKAREEYEFTNDGEHDIYSHISVATRTERRLSDEEKAIMASQHRTGERKFLPNRHVVKIHERAGWEMPKEGWHVILANQSIYANDTESFQITAEKFINVPFGFWLVYYNVDFSSAYITLSRVETQDPFDANGFLDYSRFIKLIPRPLEDLEAVAKEKEKYHYNVAIEKGQQAPMSAPRMIQQLAEEIVKKKKK